MPASSTGRRIEIFTVQPKPPRNPIRNNSRWKIDPPANNHNRGRIDQQDSEENKKNPGSEKGSHKGSSNGAENGSNLKKHSQPQISKPILNIRGRGGAGGRNNRDDTGPHSIRHRNTLHKRQKRNNQDPSPKAENSTYQAGENRHQKDRQYLESRNDQHRE